MGYLGEIERRKQQTSISKMQAEEREGLQKQIYTQVKSFSLFKKGQELEKVQTELESKARISISKSKLLIPILEAFNTLGYKNYLEDVSKISETDFEIDVYGYRTLGKTKILQIRDHNLSRELIQQEEKYDKLRTGIFFSLENHPENSEFFGNTEFVDITYAKRNFWEKFMNTPLNLRRMEFSEPKEVALGIHFKRELESRSRRISFNIINDNMIRENCLTESLHSNVYVRVMNAHNAIITGKSIQLQADFSKMDVFDEALAKVMSDPVISYSKKFYSELESDYEELYTTGPHGQY